MILAKDQPKTNKVFSTLFLIILIAASVFTLFYLTMNFLNAANHDLTDKIGNAYGLTISLLLSLLLFCYAVLTRDIEVALTGALAIFCGAIADIYWSTYLIVTGESFPVANVADLGFIGVYLLLITVIDKLSARQTRFNLNVCLVALIVVFGVLLAITQNKLFVLACFTVVSAVCIVKTVSLLSNASHLMLAAGIIMLSLSDTIIVYLGNLTDGQWLFIPDSLYMLSFCFIAYGIVRNKKQLATAST